MRFGSAYDVLLFLWPMPMCAGTLANRGTSDDPESPGAFARGLAYVRYYWRGCYYAGCGTIAADKYAGTRKARLGRGRGRLT